MRAKLAKLGLAAVLAYGLFDGVTYTTFFILAFLGYEKSTGKNPAANLQALLGVCLSDSFSGWFHVLLVVRVRTVYFNFIFGDCMHTLAEPVVDKHIHISVYPYKI
jgi:hypothetical protein